MDMEKVPNGKGCAVSHFDGWESRRAATEAKLTNEQRTFGCVCKRVGELTFPKYASLFRGTKQVAVARHLCSYCAWICLPGVIDRFLATPLMCDDRS